MRYRGCWESYRTGRGKPLYKKTTSVNKVYRRTFKCRTKTRVIVHAHVNLEGESSKQTPIFPESWKFLLTFMLMVFVCVGMVTVGVMACVVSSFVNEILVSIKTLNSFGLKTAGAVFTRMMNKLIQPLNAPEIVNFIDDVLVGTETVDRHVGCVDKLMKRMDDCNLAVRPSKCFLGYTQVEYLGHVVGKGVIKPMADKLGKIKDAPIPTTKKQVRSFLGLAGFYRTFVPHFSEIAAPLTDATQKNKPNQVTWTAELQSSFNR